MTDPGFTMFVGYDNSGSQTSQRDAAGDWTTDSEDGDDEPVATTDANGNISRTVYDLAGEAIATRQPRQHDKDELRQPGPRY